MSKNAEGWIRHRGGKCPVEKGVRVDVRHRDGEISMNQPALEKGHPVEAWAKNWSHESNPADIMAYRLHKPAEQVEACSKPELKINLPEGYGEIYNAHAVEQGPLQWRDRITEIDATTQALTTERAELVQKLASEGFALIGRATDSTAVLPRDQWKLGDLVVRVRDGEESVMPLNEPMKITFFDGSNRGQDVEVGGKYFPNVSSLLWHSRPSA